MESLCEYLSNFNKTTVLQVYKLPGRKLSCAKSFTFASMHSFSPRLCAAGEAFPAETPLSLASDWACPTEGTGNRGGKGEQGTKVPSLWGAGAASPSPAGFFVPAHTSGSSPFTNFSSVKPFKDAIAFLIAL